MNSFIDGDSVSDAQPPSKRINTEATASSTTTSEIINGLQVSWIYYLDRNIVNSWITLDNKIFKLKVVLTQKSKSELKGIMIKNKAYHSSILNEPYLNNVLQFLVVFWSKTMIQSWLVNSRLFFGSRYYK